MDQILNQAVKRRHFTGGKLSVPLVIRTPIASRLGVELQHSLSFEASFMCISGIKIAIPSNTADPHGHLPTALLDSNPVLFVENVRLYGRRAKVDLGAPPIPFGTARIACEGKDVTVVALSSMVDPAEQRRAWQRVDPILRYCKSLLAWRVAGDRERVLIDEEAHAEAKPARAVVEAASFLASEAIFGDVFAPTPGA